MKLKNIEAVLFDLDFTLVDASPAVHEGVNFALFHLGLPYIDYDNLKELTNFSLPEHELFSVFSKITNGNFLEKFYIFKGKYYEKIKEVTASKTKFIENAYNILNFLKKKELKIGIVTSKGRLLTIETLKKLDVLNMFDVIMCKEDVVKPKPHPEGICKALNAININKNSSVIYIGDDIKDGLAAEAAGVRFIGIPFVSKESAFIKHGYQVFYNLSDVENYLDKQIKFCELIKSYKSLYGHVIIQNSLIDTEDVSPITAGLSEILKKDLTSGYNLLVSADIFLLNKLKECSKTIKTMENAFIHTLMQGGRVFLYGCGASGRLLLLLDKIILSKYPPFMRRFVSIMAGGDIALARSIPNFEDRSDFGMRQLRQSGWSPERDLLIGVSASGTARFILEVLYYASTCSTVNPVFLLCNSLEKISYRIDKHPILTQIKNNKIATVELNIGPMAIAGSTRMQAATACIIAIGIAMKNCIYHFNNITLINTEAYIDKLINEIRKINSEELTRFVYKEAEAYLKGGYVLYVTDDEASLQVLMDTTERNATFNLPAFSNKFDKKSDIEKPLCLLKVDGSYNENDAWKTILGRNPQALEWEDVIETNSKMLNGFNFSDPEEIYLKNRFIVNYDRENNKIKFIFNNIRYSLPVSNDELTRHVIMKVVLNNHSTSVMGLLNYYDSNIMSNVTPSNTKLIFRIIYYVWKNIKLLDHDFYRLPKSINHRYTFYDIESYVLNNITNFKYRQSVINIVTHSLLDKFRYELFNRFLLREKYTHIHLKFKEQVLGQWILNMFHGEELSSIIKIKGCASDREYFRVFINNSTSVILMDSSSINDNTSFLTKTWLLRSINIPLSDIYGYNLKLGMILLEDLGDVTLLEYLNQIKYEEEKLSSIYKHAIDIIKLIQVYYPNYKDLMEYDKKTLINVY